jgi:hypothetical protein
MLILIEDSLRKRVVTLLRLMLKFLEVLRCMGEIPMIIGC